MRFMFRNRRVLVCSWAVAVAMAVVAVVAAFVWPSNGPAGVTERPEKEPRVDRNSFDRTFCSTHTHNLNRHTLFSSSSSFTPPVSYLVPVASTSSLSTPDNKHMLLSTIRKPLPLPALMQTLPALPQDHKPALPLISSLFSNTNTATKENDTHFACPNNKILNHRHLIELNKVTNPLKTISVSSYNILCRHYLWEPIYSYLRNDYTSWYKRFDRLNQSFSDLSKLSDIMCFQEMEYQIYRDYWKSYMGNLGYDSIYQKKPKPGYWKKSTNMMDGVSIFYNKEKFELLNYETINFANHFKNSTVIEQTLDTQTRLNIRNTVAVIAVLKHKFTNEVIFVSNTHLYWSPKHDDVKLMQVLLLTNLLKKSITRFYNISESELDERIKNKTGPNIIMVGDFNTNPTSMVYKFMSNGLLDRGKEPNFTQDYGPNVSKVIENHLGTFKSPYADLYSKGIFKKTTFTPKFKEVIDYMWFNEGNDRFKFTKVLGDIDQDYLKDYQGFPNPDFPSDHFPILSQFEFK